MASEGHPDLVGEPPEGWLDRTVAGIAGTEFLFEQDVDVVPVWGTKEKPRWAAGEPLYIFAKPGLGKSTLAQNLALGRLGVPKYREVLDAPVAVGSGTVLYLAMDRPKQVARSMARMVEEADRDLLREYLRFWAGTPPFYVTDSPKQAFAEWVAQFGVVKTVIVDSLFNLAPTLTDEDGSARANNAFQHMVGEGAELVVIHHDRKAGENRRRSGMDDMYGGRAISAGAGSICSMEGSAEDGYHLRWVKTPAGPLPGMDYSIDFAGGRVTAPGFFGAIKKGAA